MSDDMRIYSQQLRQLVDEYYHQQISVDVYHAQRKLIFDKIEMEQAGDSGSSETRKKESLMEPTPHS
jgi:hypothetical protein